jgi:hypothetical protein
LAEQVKDAFLLRCSGAAAKKADYGAGRSTAQDANESHEKNHHHADPKAITACFTPRHAAMRLN